MSADLLFADNVAFDDFEERLGKIELYLRANSVQHVRPYVPYAFFAAVTCGGQRAKVTCATGQDFEQAWSKLRSDVEMSTVQIDAQKAWIRVDHVTEVRPISVAALQTILTRTKRNYFRFGIAFDPQFNVAFTEQELNANAVLYGGNSIHHAIINHGNLRKYAALRHPGKTIAPLTEDSTVYLFRTAGLFIDEMGAQHEIISQGLDSGRRNVEQLDDEPLLAIIQNSSSYLAKEVKEDGRFVYGYHPCFDREIAAYNVLRHASSTYAMVEAWVETGDERVKEAIDRSLNYLLKAHIKHVTLDSGETVAFLVEEDGAIKLGGNAVAILALMKYINSTGSREHLVVAERLAAGICSMQNRSDGSFSHVLNYPDLSVKAQFRIVYYDGEAAFALMRLYELTKDDRWIAAVERAFDYFIAKEHWQHHDHWLAYCVNELTTYRPDKRYFEFAVRNIEGYLDFVEHRITTFPTLLELMMATRLLLSRMSEIEDCQPLLDTVDLSHFERAMHRRAHYLLNGYFWPEMAMFYANPSRIVNSFFIRHHAFRVRIDDVEHYLSGLVAYRKFLKEQMKFRALVAVQAARRIAAEIIRKDIVMSKEKLSWDKQNIIEATGGTWLREPEDGWQGTGLCTYLPAMKDGAVAVLRQEEGEVGIAAQLTPRIRNAAAYMVTDSTDMADSPVPVLQVSDNKQAVLAMGRYARAQMSGKVIGITGSAGKTTMVAMVSHLLTQFGRVSSTQCNANLPVGVAWNLASMPWDSDFVALELAVGRMGVSAQIARPNIAVFTNVLPAHLGETSTVADIAKTKSAIFSGMQEGDVAILNRDMMEWDIVYQAAQAQKLKVVTYGMCTQCNFRLTAYDSGSQRVYAEIDGTEVSYRIGAGGQHSALNSLAVLALVSQLNISIDDALEHFATFAALPGRGEVLNLTLYGKTIKLIDDAYNANPGSMRAALQHLSDTAGKRRIALLGEMLDLGEETRKYHTELASLINASQITQVYAVGDFYSEFWQALAPEKRGLHLVDRAALMGLIQREMQDGDVVLVKGSHGTQMHVTIDELKKLAATQAG